jgi:DNA-binding CsgD family transcriptional regulator
VRRCYAGLDAASLRDEALRGLRSLISIDAAFFATVDPTTILFTSMMAEEPLHEATALFLENEFGRDDVNKFATLATAGDRVSSLDLATAGRRETSLRYSQVLAPLELGDELRAALVADGQCWGVLCLHRQNSPTGFSAREVALVRRLAPHLAEGLRRAVVVRGLTTADSTVRGPGVIVLDEDMSISNVNAEAEQWLTELRDPAWTDPGEGALPAAIHAVVARATGIDGASGPAAPATRLRTSSGHWLTAYASRLGGPSGRQTAVVLEAARPAEMASLYLDAHGLTAAQARVASLVLQGRSTRQIVNELHISTHTVQEHLRAVFDKFGIGSRRELVAVLLGQSP